MKVLNLLTGGNAGGIERLCLDIGNHADYENGFCFLTHGGVFLDQMKADGLAVYDLTGLGGKFSLKKLKQLCKIAADYDIITAHHPDPFLKIYFLLLRPLKKKMVTVVHSCFDGAETKNYGPCKKLLHKEIFQASLTVSNAIVFVSRAGMESYQQFFRFQKSKAEIIYNGIRPELIQRGKNHQLNLEKPYHLTFIGRLFPWKGVDLLLQAAKELAGKWPIQLHIVGDGTERASLEALSREFGIAEITQFHGQDFNIEKHLQKASVFVYPSRWQEIFGISLVEAMAFGVPCVAAKVGGIPEVIADGRTGYLFACDDADDLTEKLETVLYRLENGDICEMVSAAKEAAAEFCITNTISRLKELFSTL